MNSNHSTTHVGLTDEQRHTLAIARHWIGGQQRLIAQGAFLLGVCVVNAVSALVGHYLWLCVVQLVLCGITGFFLRREYRRLSQWLDDAFLRVWDEDENA